MSNALDREVRVFVYGRFVTEGTPPTVAQVADELGVPLDSDLVWELGKTAYADKLSPDWSRTTPEEDEAHFVSLGLTGDFWRLTGSG